MIKNPYSNLRLCLVLVISTYVCLLQAGQSFLRYDNDRFGFSLEYPADFKLEQPPYNGDGQIFHDDHGFTMTASARNNLNDDTLASELKSDLEFFDKITYRTKGKNWLVLSGIKDKQILYIKAYVGKGAINYIDIRYPEKDAAIYESILTRIAHSFKPGNLGVFHEFPSHDPDD